MLKPLYNWIRYHFYTIQSVEWLLKSPFFLKSPLYQYIIRKGVRRTQSKPAELLIEPTNHCNLACLTCPHSRMKRSRGVMSLGLFKRLADQADELDIRNIKLAGLGEPLLDRDIAEKIAYAKKKNICVKMYTNGMLLTEEKARQLVEAGIDEMLVSIDGGTPAVQERIRKGSSFSRIQENLGHMARIRQQKKAAGERVPGVVINVTYQEDNREERMVITKNWGHLADNIRLFPVHNWEVAVKVPRRPSQPCHLPFFQMAICWDGRVALCCIDYECRRQLGDAAAESLSSIWQGAAFAEVRGLHLGCTPDAIDLCRSCSMLPNWFFSAGL